MGIAERKERARENLRQDILEAAAELFAEEGYANLSMRKIAEKIEYSPTTIYLYFKDKNELVHEVCEATFSKLTEQITEVQDNSSTPLDVLRNGMKTYVEFGLSHPKHYEMVFITPLPTDSLSDKTFEDSMGRRAFERMRAAVSMCMESGDIAKGDVELISQALWAGIHGVTALLIGHGDFFPFVERERLVDCVIDTLIEGLKA